MLSSLKALAAAVDGLSARGLATLTETPSALTIASLPAAELEQLFPLLTAVGWRCDIIDGAGERAETSTFKSDYQPFIVTVEKPSQAAALRVVTSAGLRAFLLAERGDELWEVATLATPFATMAASFLPWGSSSIFSPAPATKSPRQLVKDHKIPPSAPNDIRVWMLRTPASEQLWGDPVFQTFAELSAGALMRALASEIKNDGDLVFTGPPRTQLDAPRIGAGNELKLNGYNDLLAAAAWVYENVTEAEQRHGLFAAEFGRTHPPAEAETAAVFAAIAANVLEGARLAYQLSLSDLTREAIKAQGDLRKAVADDTAKLADNARQVVTAVAAALATCIGLVAAKVGTTTPHWLLAVVAFLAGVYVCVVVATGWVFMSVQRDMRQKWRSRLYRFIPKPDYDAMVVDPAGRAEAMFTVSAIAGGVVATFAIVIILMVFLTP
ncbi:MAG: hypothetical protein ABSF49_04075 [Roseiarcus sp.]|jgi:hypothetical protein|uniref:hypothetical protein n=1 Tax=Roseiarcus sp. TaxID=1969460 RepID=UPI003C21786F